MLHLRSYSQILTLRRTGSPETNTLAYFAELSVTQKNVLSTRGQCYKTFYGRELRLFIIARALAPNTAIILPGTNALAYSEKFCLTAVKSFITLATDLHVRHLQLSVIDRTSLLSAIDRVTILGDFCQLGKFWRLIMIF
jgi:hypothetical protein